MAIGLASLLLGRQVFSQPKGESYLAEVKEARLANGDTEKRIEAEGLPIYMDKGDAFWIRPMKTTIKGRAVVFIITRSSVCGGQWEPRCHCGGLSHSQCSHGKCYAKNH